MKIFASHAQGALRFTIAHMRWEKTDRYYLLISSEAEPHEHLAAPLLLEPELALGALGALATPATLEEHRRVIEHTLEHGEIPRRLSEDKAPCSPLVPRHFLEREARREQRVLDLALIPRAHPHLPAKAL